MALSFHRPQRSLLGYKTFSAVLRPEKPASSPLPSPARSSRTASTASPSTRPPAQSPASRIRSSAASWLISKRFTNSTSISTSDMRRGKSPLQMVPRPVSAVGSQPGGRQRDESDRRTVAPTSSRRLSFCITSSSASILSWTSLNRPRAGPAAFPMQCLNKESVYVSLPLRHSDFKFITSCLGPWLNRSGTNSTAPVPLTMPPAFR